MENESVIETARLNQNKDDAFSPQKDKNEENNFTPQKEKKEEVLAPVEQAKKELLFGSGKSVGICKLFCNLSTPCDVILMILAICGSIVSGAALPLYSMLLGDTLSGYGPRNTPQEVDESMNVMVVRFLYIGAAMFVAFTLNIGLWTIVGKRHIFRLKEDYFKLLMKQEQGWFDHNNPFEFSTKVETQIRQIEAGLGNKMGNLLNSLSQFSSGLIIAFISSWKLSLVLISVLPVMLICTILLTKTMEKGAFNSMKSYEKAGGIAEELLYSIKTVSSFVNYKFEKERYEECTEISKREGVKNGLRSGLGIGIFFTVVYATYGLAIWYGSSLIVNSEINSNTHNVFQAGDVLTVMFAMIMSSTSLGSIAPNMKFITEACVAASDFFELKNRKPLIDLSQSTLKPNKEEMLGEVDFNKVVFAYPNKSDLNILKGITIKFNAGKKTAIVGESGSGKSTIVNLIERLYDATEGEILIDGVNIKQFDLEYLRSLIGYVQQEPVLFNKSIRDNIIFGRENITNEMIDEACDKAYATEFIKDKGGYDYVVGIKGSKLSGGQKQRIAIARAILTRPKLLILDEATSALDNQSEKEVQKALDKVSQGITTIIIAHRLSTIKDADTIIAMKNGEIVETGNHESLLKSEGYYAALITGQLTKDDKEEEEKSNVDQNNNIPKISEVMITGEQYENKVLLASENNKEKKEVPKESVVELSQARTQLFGLLSDHKCTLFIASIFAAVNGVVYPVYGVVLALAISGLSDTDMEKVSENGTFLGLMFVVIAVGSGVAAVFQNYKFTEIGEILCQKLRNLTFEKYLRLDMGFYDKTENTPGTLLTRLSGDSTLMNGIVLTMVGVYVQAFVNIITGLTIAFIYEWRLSLISLAFMPFIMIVTMLQNKVRMLVRQEFQELEIEAGGVLSESVVNTKTIFSFNMQSKVINMYNEILRPAKSGIWCLAIKTGIVFGFNQFLNYAIFAAIFYAGGKFISQGNLTLENLMKASFVIIFSSLGMAQAQQFGGDVASAKRASNNLFKIINAPTLIDTSEESNINKQSANAIRGKIEFRDVSFAYPTRPDTTVLKNINFKIETGQHIAFVGFSGSGKSTIVQLIERFYDLEESSGEILIDDVNIKSYNLLELRRQIGLVMQDPCLFKRDVKSNIKYGNLLASDEEIRDAASKANIIKFFDDEENGKKDTPVSGGEKQRIAIARTMVKNPKILLLDEATSALDRENEMEVQKALDVLMEGKTTICIAHRLSTIENCHMIYVMEGGEIVESGNHNTLLESKGKYYALYKSQMS